MAKNNQDDTSKHHTTESEDQIEHLSNNEKLAFEKIMNEIEDIDTNNDNSEKSPANVDLTRNDTPKTGPDNSVTKLNGVEGITDPESEATSTEAENPSEALDDEQQAALDKIMTEINGDDGEPAKDAAEPEATSSAEAENPSETLDDEQQAALDKIMTEINGDDGEPAKDAAEPEATSSAEAENPSETLDDEQQAALDKIMAEINGDDGDATPEPEATSSDEAENPSEALDDEQQAALDKIMTEINGDDGDATPEPEAPSSDEAENPSEALDDEQQAALDKIMTEINGGDGEPAKDAAEPEPGATPEPPADSGATAPTRDNPTEGASQGESQETAKTELSFEEFNDELTNLLSNADSLEEKKDANKAPEVLADDSAESGATSTDPSPAIGELPDDEKRQNTTASETGNQNDYSILQEVTNTENQTSKQTQQKRPRKARVTKPKKGKRVFHYSLAALLLIGICTAAYWRYGLPVTNTASISLLSETPKTVSPPATENDNAPLSDAAIQESVAAGERDFPKGAPIENVPLAPSLLSLREEIASTREHVMLKIEEIKELKAYYQNGVKESREKILASTATVKSDSLKAALKNRQIELDLRAIQRRMVYTDKLEIPIQQLSSSSEELLYLERKTQLLETLQQGVTGLSIDEFEKEVLRIVDKHLKRSNKLSIDHIDAEPPTLDSIWADIRSKAITKSGGQKNINSKQDNVIQQEICMGKYDRKYLLTALGPKSAECLSKWPGKDLYLNSLTKLPPSVAKTLSQWPGEWLSLNGLTELPTESAKYLSQWKGKRLSLNGLNQLSRKATQQLSKWQGEQLEMVGLRTIGRWENYATRLYLSEKLSRKLQIQ